MSYKDLLYFYRVLNWKHKISGIRFLGFAFFGYAWAAKLEIIPLTVNTLALLGATLFWYSINDYFDLKSQNEQNYMATLIKSGKITTQKALFLCLTPLVLAPFIFPTGSNLAIFIFFLILTLNFFYSAPPLSFKKRGYWALIASAIAAPLLFLESQSVLGKISLQTVFMAILISLFFSYLEIIHILEDFQTGEKIKILNSPRAALKILKILPFITLVVSFIFSLYNPIFLITAIFSVVRIISLKNFKKEEVQKTRRNLLSPRLSLYEFALYALLSITGHI